MASSSAGAAPVATSGNANVPTGGLYAPPFPVDGSRAKIDAGLGMCATRGEADQRGRRDRALGRLAPLPGGPPTLARLLPLVVSLVALQATAYLLVLLPLSFGFNRFSGLELVKYQLISTSNALAGPAILLLVVVLTKSRLLVLTHHLLQLVAFLAVSIYAGYFDAFPHLSLLRQAAVLPSVRRHIAVQLVGADEIAIVAVLAASCLVAARLAKRLRGLRPPRRTVAALLVVLAAFAAKDAFLHTRLPIWKYRYDGIYFFKRYGFIPILGAQLLGELRARPAAGPWPGVLNADGCRALVFPEKRPNVLLVQVESLDPWVIDHEAGGGPVMPFLRDLKTRTLSFANFFSQHRGGGSADAELACLTGLLPLGSHSGFLTADFSRIISLPQILAAAGYYTCAMHANAGSYFYRRPAFRRLGFNDFFDRDAYSGDAAGWRSKDHAFFAQSLAILERSPRPFFTYIITIQSHGPFDNHAPTNKFAASSGGDPLLGDYLAVMAEVDAALALLVGELERRGEWESTVFALMGDHTSGVKPPAARRPAAPGDRDRIPLLLHAPGVSPGISFKVGSPLDLGPTLLHLIGAPPVAYSMGTSLLDEGIGRVFLNAEGTVVLLRNREAGAADLAVARDLDPYRRFFDYSEGVLHP